MPGRRAGGDVSLLRQAFALRSTFPESQVSLHGETLTWVGQLRPSELSPPYSVRITYTRRHYPQVQVLDPPIIDEHDFVPHVYNTGDLCVHDDQDWSPRLLLINSVVAWTIEWLLFWELFLATGRWFGDGPDTDSPPSEPLDQLPAPGEPHLTDQHGELHIDLVESAPAARRAIWTATERT